MTELRSPRAWLAAAWSLFQLYTAYAGMFDLLIQLPIHVAFAVALAFLTPAISDAGVPRRRGPVGRWADTVAAVLALACAAHYVYWNKLFVSRMALVDDPRPIDLAVG